MELTRNLRIDSVSRLAPSPPLSLEAEQTVGDAVALLQKHKVGCLLVLRDGQLAGLFTERDLMYRVLGLGKPLTTPLSAVMTANPVSVLPKDSIRTAIRRMQNGGYRRLPVVDETNRPVGVLSVKRIVHYLVEHYPSAVYNLPPDPSNVPQEREGA